MSVERDFEPRIVECCVKRSLETWKGVLVESTRTVMRGLCRALGGC